MGRKHQQKWRKIHLTKETLPRMIKQDAHWHLRGMLNK